MLLHEVLRAHYARCGITLRDLTSVYNFLYREVTSERSPGKKADNLRRLPARIHDELQYMYTVFERSIFSDMIITKSAKTMGHPCL